MVLIKVLLLDCFIVAEIFTVPAKAETIPIIKVASTVLILNFSINKIRQFNIEVQFVKSVNYTFEQSL